MPNVVFDASSIVGAALKQDSMPGRALLLAHRHETICLSVAVETEIREVLQRPKFHEYIADATRARILDILGAAASRFEPIEQVTDCRDKKDDKYLELALAAGASTIVSSDDDLLGSGPLAGHPYPQTRGLREIVERHGRSLNRRRCELLPTGTAPSVAGFGENRPSLRFSQ